MRRRAPVSTADSSVDLVEDERHLPSGRGSECECDAAELAARGGLRDRRERQAGVRADQEGDGVRARRAQLALGELDVELAVAQADPAQLRRDGGRKALGGRDACLVELRRDRLHACLGLRQCQSGLRRRIGAGLASLQLGAGSGSSLEQLFVRFAAEPALRGRDPFQLGLEVLQPVGLGFERVEEAAEVGADVCEPDLEVAQLGRRRRELRREPLERRDRALRLGRQHRSALTVLRGERLGRRRRALGELGQVAQPLALGEQRHLGVGLEPSRVLDEGLELGEPCLRGFGVGRDLVMTPLGRSELTPDAAQISPPAELLITEERVEHLELVRRTREPALLELARHPDEKLGRGCEILPRSRPPPCVGAGASVGKDPAREHEPPFVLGPQLGERLEPVLLEEPVGEVELGLDIGLLPGLADRLRVALRTE